MDLYGPDLIFLSEPQTFQADLPSIIDYFKGDYNAFLNSEDLLKPELSFQANRTKGGTMLMWKKHLDPYISVYEPESSSFLFMILDIPGYKTSIHASLYLPTAGKDLEYLAEIATLIVNVALTISAAGGLLEILVARDSSCSFHCIFIASVKSCLYSSFVTID